MGTIVKPHVASDGAPARPDHVNEMLDTLYNEINGNLDWDNLKAALVNAANGLVKLDGDAKIPLPQIPAGIDADKVDGLHASEILPSGVIVMWSGTLATIPSGWSLCDGSGGTPDLRGKFIYGTLAGVDPGDTGGAVTHTHGPGSYATPAHNHGGVTGSTSGAIHSGDYPNIVVSEHTHTIPEQAIASITGTSAAGSSLPPYFKLAFIIKD